MEEGGGGEPHPVSGVERPIGVQQQLFEDGLTFLPRLPKIAAGEVTGNRVTSQMMNPTLIETIRWSVS